jgi:hypothetical protein
VVFIQPEARFSATAMGQAKPEFGDRLPDEQRAKLVPGVFSQAVDIEFADTSDRRDTACSLINKRYAWRGYGSHHALPSHRASATFTASAQSEVLGTVTLVVDSDIGLAADKIFAEELDAFRNAEGRKICELSRLAFETSLPSKPLLAALFHIVFIYGYHHHRCTDLFIEVNPRHRRFYEAMLGFKPIGVPRTNESVAAPSQLMWLEIASIRPRIEMAAVNATSDKAQRSLYSLFFSRDDALELAEELTSDEATQRTMDGNALVKIYLSDL